MAVTKLSDIIIPEVFAPYMLERTTELSAIISAGIAQRSSEFDALANGGGKTVNMPFWDDLTGDSEVLSDSADLTANAITADQDAAAINNRGRAWGANDLTKWISGDDPSARIANLAAGFWARDMQRILIKILEGLFNTTNGVLESTHLLNIYSDVASPADTNRLTGSTFIDGLTLLGDASSGLTAVAMHSEVEAYLRQQDLIDDIPDSEGKFVIASFQGRRVVIDDNCPKTAGTNSPSYLTYLFGQGAFAWGEASLDPEIAVETDRQVLSSNDILATRRRFILHPRGVEWTGTAAGASPTNSEFATGTNWAKAYQDKNIRIAAVLHNV